MITSYAQNFEDVMLWRALKHINKGCYIDIGVRDPVIDSVSLAFYEKNWRGIHIEPDTHYAKILQNARKDETVLNALISDSEGTIIFYEITQIGLSTCDLEIAIKHKANGYSVKETIVPKITLEQVINNYSQDEVHWLKINTDGMEEKALKCWNNAIKKPWVIVIKTANTPNQVDINLSFDKDLNDKGYDSVYFDGLNRFYVSKMHPELINAFRYGPNILDGFALSISTSYCRNQLYEQENFKSEILKTLSDLEKKKHELQSIYDTTLGRIIKIYNKIKRKKKKLLDKKSHQEYFDIFDGNIIIKFHAKALNDTRGIGRVSRELLKQIQEQNPENNIRKNTDSLKKVFFYSTIHNCPIKLPKPSCILIHDVIPMLFPDIFGNDAVQWNTKYKFIAQQACKIVTISKSSAIDISRMLEIPIEKIEIIHNGITTFPITKKQLFRLPPGDFIVYLGAYDRHKNIEIIFQAMLQPEIRDISLVMIGNNNKAKDLITKYGLKNRVHLFGQLSDGHAGFVISKALALVFPSIYEGFGLPPLEAALLDTPSICSYRPAMTEIMADIALFAAPDKPEEWAKAIFNLRENPNLRTNLALLSKEKAHTYTWKKSADALINVLNKLV